MKIYGIKNCDTVKKAIKWLTDNGFQPQLHDYHVDGIEREWLMEMSEKFGWESLVNKRSTTWRSLGDDIKYSLNYESALNVLLEQPTLIKRPILISKDIALLGFSIDEYKKAFKK